MIRRLILIILSLLSGGCLGIPNGVTPVSDFQLQRYLGKWYEIARLDHSFERGMERVTAEYSMRDDGGIRVINRGYDNKASRWKEAEGKAYFAAGDNEGYLKVSFFGPFYGSYILFELDREGYQYSFVTSSSRSYLWLLARSPSVSNEVRERFVSRAKELGYATDKLIYVRHD